MTPAEPVVRDVYAAFARGDLEAVLRPLAPDCDWRCLAPAPLPFAGAFRGPEGARDFFGRVLAHVRLDVFAPRRFLADGDTVVVTGEDQGTVLATGRAYAVEWVHVWTVHDGRVTAFREFLDPAIAAAF